MTSQEYWRQREAAQRKKNLTSEAEYQKEIQRIYTEMLDSIQQEIDSFYAKYAEKEGITLAQAKQRVSRLDIEEYQRKAARYVKDRDFSDQANAEMRLYNLTMKINRLEMLKANIGMELVESFDELQKFFGEKLTNRALDEFERLAGIFGDTVQNNAKRAATIVNASFHHATFSDRIWMYQDVLKSELSKLLEQGMIQGKGSRELARSLRKVFDTSRSDAERLMSTELRRVQTEAAKQSYEANENDEYEFMTANAQGPCDVCKKLNGKIFKVKDMMPGKNAPPMHPRCHCCTAPHWDEAKFQAYLREENRKMHQRDGAKKVAENSRRGIIKLNRSAKRKDKNIGAFYNLEVPMQKREVKRIAKKYGVNLTGLTIKIQRNEKLLSLPTTGMTDYKNIGRIDLLPNAFLNEEQLVRTLIHEKCHVMQLKKHGARYAQDNLQKMEAQAYRFEDFWYSRLVREMKQHEMD